MALRVRRVVTGHDAAGHATVTIDEVTTNVKSLRPGHQSCVIWATTQAPADNSGSGDDALKATGTGLPGGTVFRIMELQPGVAPRMHRTDTCDYVIVLAGEVHMQLDDAEVHLKTGDVLVQRGTVHNWINRGTEPCVLGVVLVDAKPVAVGEKTLSAHG